MKLIYFGGAHINVEHITFIRKEYVSYNEEYLAVGTTGGQVFKEGYREWMYEKMKDLFDDQESL